MNEYYVPGFTGYLQRSVLEGGGGSTLESLPATVDPLTGELVYAPPTAQPVMAEPVPAAYSLPTAQPVVAEAMPTAYGLPTEQPVVAEPAPAETTPIDLGGWSLENFQKQFMRGDPAQADAMNKWIAAQAAQGREYFYDPQDNLAHQIAMNSLVPMGGPDYSSFDPNDPTSSMAEIFRFDIDQNKNTAPAAFRTGDTFVLTDASGKNVLGRASSPEEMRALIEAANAKQYGWNLYKGDAEGNYTLGTELFGESDPRASGLMGALLNFGIPLALSFVPGLGWAGSAALSGAGATTGGLIGGKTLGDALKSGALTAATAGLLKGTGLDKAIGGALEKVPVVGDALQAVGKTFAPGAAKAIGDEIVVNALTGAGGNVLAPALANLASGALGAAGQVSNLADAAKQAQQQPQQLADGYQGLTVLGNRGAALVSNALPGTLAGALNAAQLSGTNYGDQLWGEQQQQPEQPPETQDPNAIEVAGQKTPAPTSGVPVPVSGVVPSIPTVDPVYGEIVVSNKYKPPSVDDRLAALTAAAAPILNTPTPTTPTTPPAEKGAIAKGLDVIDYLRLAGLGIGAIGSLFEGGGGSSSNFRVPGGMGSLHPSFSAKLPTANIPGLTGGTAAAPRTAANLGTQGLRTPQDYYRYGYGPEQSFFNYVPEAEKNTSTAYTGYAEGGFAVEGPGDGRDDKIPAMLSDGEYVIDAETVALLGNGSNRAGADMLDQFRVNVRKHKGRELTRGQFSKNAKKPEQYLAGGRA